MKLLLPFLVAALPAASVAQSQSAEAASAPAAAIPKTTAVLVIQTAKQGITPEQVQRIVAVMPSEIRARGGASDSRNAAPREGTPDGSRVHSGRAAHAAEGIDGQWAGGAITEDG